MSTFSNGGVGGVGRGGESRLFLSIVQLCFLCAVVIPIYLPVVQGYAFHRPLHFTASITAMTTTSHHFCRSRHHHIFGLSPTKSVKQILQQQQQQQQQQHLLWMSPLSSSYDSSDTTTGTATMNTGRSNQTVLFGLSAIPTDTSSTKQSNNVFLSNQRRPLTLNGNPVSSNNNGDKEGMPAWLQEKVNESLRRQQQQHPDQDNNNNNNNNVSDVPVPTANGGYAHTSTSKAKIAAANKGKTPWNKGKGHSEEVKARIAAGVRRRNHEKLLQKLKDMGITEEEYTAQEAKKKAEKEARILTRKTEKGGYRPTDETRAKISKVLKSKWANGEVKKRSVDPSKVRRGFTHTAETRAKISASLRKRWANDEEYRANMTNKTMAVNSRPEIRQKISETLRRKWEDPDFRANMTAKMATRNKRSSGNHDLSHREKISQAMKAKWQDEAYRKRATEAMKARQAELSKLRPPRIKKEKVKKPKTANTTTTTSSSSRASTNGPTATGMTNLKASNRPRLAEPLSAPKPKVKGIRKQQQTMPPRNSVQIVGSSGTNGGTPGTTIAPDKKLKLKQVTKKENDTSITAATTAPGVGAAKATSAETKSNSKSSKQRNSKKEAPGSKTRLREERRDLYDLLYGDEALEDDENENDGDDLGTATLGGHEASNRKHDSVFLEDENLDDFDPYGLDNF